MSFEAAVALVFIALIVAATAEHVLKDSNRTQLQIAQMECQQ